MAADAVSNPSPTAPGIVTRPSPHTAAQTVARLEAEIARRGLAIFARFDHAAAAVSVGLAMPFTCVLVFGNPRAGTPVMIASPLIAIELPLRVLVWSDSGGHAFVGYSDPIVLAARYAVPDSLAGNIGAVGAIVEAALG